MTETDFIDSYLRNIKAEVRELEATVAMMAMFFSALAFAKSIKKDEDNFAERGAAKWSMRMLDKFSDELGFFYSYGSLQAIIGSGNILPVLSTLNDLRVFTTHLAREGYYIYTGDDEAESKNKLLKYPINYIPVINQLSSYGAIFNKDWADIMGTNTNYNYGSNFGR